MKNICTENENRKRQKKTDRDRHRQEDKLQRKLRRRWNV
jgi:hypothetical protein